ncbi:hypothetical protein [Nocardia sp. NPDC005825]|uniref:hypothetical protein n=1 Tax=unclassified Nocardia TaxID=2637762 RepID=UPI0033FB806C
MTAAESTEGQAWYRLRSLRLDPGGPLGEGGAAEIWRCTVPDRDHLVFKRFRDEARADLDGDRLRQLVAWPRRLAPEDRERLLARCAWPSAVVTDGAEIVGVVLPEAPAGYFHNPGSGWKPRHFTRLAVPEQVATRRGFEYYDFPHKLARLGRLLGDLDFLHDNGIVIGDLQPNNILVTGAAPAGQPVVTDNYFLDCDSFLIDGHSAMPNLDPLPWRPQYANGDGFTPTTDLFKFALLAIRCLAEDLAADRIDYGRFGQLLPMSDFEAIDALLTSPAPALTSADLRSLARAWQSVVRPDGGTFRRTDTVLLERWSPAMRVAHLAEMTTVAEPVAASQDLPVEASERAAKLVPVLLAAALAALIILVVLGIAMHG